MAGETSGTEINGMDTEKRLERELKASLADGYLPCATAFQIAKRVGVSRRQVGDMANRQKVRIVDCQLGCFQFKNSVHDLDSLHISQALIDKVTASLIDGRLPCTLTFEIAKESKVAPGKVADVANKLKIKINNCQLGCFP